MDEKELVEKFNYFEKLYFKITLSIFTFSIVLFGIIFLITKQVYDVPKFLINLTTSFLYLAIANFIITIFRLFKYLFKIRKLPNNIGVIRSLFALVINPTSIFLLFILLILMSLSSCTVV